MSKKIQAWLFSFLGMCLFLESARAISLTGISPASQINVGISSITVFGNFTSQTEIKISTGGSYIFPVSSVKISSNCIRAAFDFSGLPTGLWDIYAVDGSTASLTGALFINQRVSSTETWNRNNLGSFPDYSLALVARDIDGDGKQEVYSANFFGTVTRIYINAGQVLQQVIASPNAVQRAITVYEGKIYSGGDDKKLWEISYSTTTATFNSQAIYTFPERIVALGSGDGDGDGQADLYVVAGGVIYQLKKNTDWQATVVYSAEINDLVVADGDGDGHLEIYAVSYSGTIYQIKKNDSWQAEIIDSLGLSDSRIVAADVNQDNLVELYVIGGSNYLYQYQFLGGNWSKAILPAGDSAYRQMVAADGNNDGRSEIYLTDTALNLTEYSFNGSSWTKTTDQNGAARSVGWVDLDYDGRIDLVSGGDTIYQYVKKNLDSLSVAGLSEDWSVNTSSAVLTIWGSNFPSPLFVYVGTYPAVRVEVLTSTAAVVTLPANILPGRYDLLVRGLNTLTVNLAGAYLVCGRSPLVLGDISSAYLTVPQRPTTSVDWGYYFYSGNTNNYLGRVSNLTNQYSDGDSFSPGRLIIRIASTDEFNCDIAAKDTIILKSFPVVVLPRILYDAAFTLYVSSDGSTYYDEALSQLAQAADFLAPAAITDLVATSAGDKCQINWTAPGDDGAIGQAYRYIVYYTSQPVTAGSDFLSSGTSFYLNLTPGPAGSPQSYLLDNLPTGNTLYLILSAQDKSLNLSGLVNWTTFYIQLVSTISITGLYPRQALVGSSLSMSVYGFGFRWPLTAKLISSGQEILANSVEVLANNRANLQFNLASNTTGLWSLVLDVGVSSATFPSAVAVHQYLFASYNLVGIATVTLNSSGYDVISLDGDGDGQPEYYVAGGDNNLYQLKYNGSGYSVTVVGSASGYLRALAWGDVDRDGKPEIYAGGYDKNLYQFKYNGGSWTKTVVGSVAGTIRGLAVGDGDNDGISEVYLASYDKNLYQFKYSGGSWIKTALGSGTNYMNGVLVGDIANSGKNQVYSSNGDGALYQFVYSTSGWQKTAVVNTGLWNRWLSMADFDGDGRKEIYLAAGNKIYQVFFNGTAWLSNILFSVGDATNNYFNNALAGDGDNDGQIEVYCPNKDHNVYQLKYQNGTWLSKIVLSAPADEVNSCVVADGDGDGYLELVSVTHTNDKKFYVSRQQDNLAPAAVNDLNAMAGVNDGEINLSWTSPGTDGTIGNFTGYYLIKYTTSTTAWPENYNLLIATSVSPATPQGWTITGLVPGEIYYLAVWSRDNYNNLSSTSNIVSVRAKESLANLIINEIAPAEVNDWIELLALSSGSVSGYKLYEAYDGGIGLGKLTTTFLTLLEPVQAGDYIIVHWAAGTSDITRPANGVWHFYIDENGLNSSQNIISLTDKYDNLEDVVAYGERTNLAAEVRSVYNYILANYPGQWNGVLASGSNDSEVNYALVPATNIVSGITIGRRPQVSKTLSPENIHRNEWAVFSVSSSGGPNLLTQLRNADINNPGAITNLAATAGTSEGTVKLNWTAPYGDGTFGAAVKSYLIHYATFPISAQTNFWNSLNYVNNLSPANPSATESFTVSGLIPGVTYYFTIESEDASLNLSLLSNWTTSFASPDFAAPNSVTDLTATLNTIASGVCYTVKLNWTAPDEDGASAGPVDLYDIRWATYSLAEVNFDTSTWWSAAKTFSPSMAVLPTPATPYWQQNLTVSGLPGGVTIYFHLKSRDNGYNWSGVDISTAGWVFVPAHIVISEIQTKGSAANDDFVEIFNPANYSVNLNGVRLVKRTKTGTSDTTLKSWTSATFIPARGFYLWANSGYTAIPVPPDTTTAGYIADDNAVALRYGVENTSSVIDAVGFGSAANVLVEGNVFPGNPAGGQSIERKGYGFDSNDNAGDFVLRTISQPQNSKCGPEPDGGPPAAITNLSALTGAVVGSVILTWTAPGDDGTLWANYRGSYEVRWATYAVSGSSVAWWNENQNRSRLLAGPLEVGLTETRTVTGLVPGTTYYFAVVARDELNNSSELDWRSASGATQASAFAFGVPPAPPGTITYLLAQPGTNIGEIALNWVAPGADGYSGNNSAGYYVVYYATYSVGVSSGVWLAAARQWIFYNPVDVGNMEVRILTGLSAGVTYYFAIKTVDNNGEYSFDEFINSADTQKYGFAFSPTGSAIPPGTITNLNVSAGISPGEVILRFVAPGDDGTSGVAKQYDIRYSLNRIVDENDFNNATRVNLNIVPEESGQWEEITISGLNPERIYYFALKAIDDGGLSGAVSSGEITYSRPAQPDKGILRATFIDVGLGDAVFLELPNGTNVLIDAGKGSAASDQALFDFLDTKISTIGAAAIDKPYTSINYLVLSNPKSEHVGGMADILNRYYVNKVYDSGYNPQTVGYLNFLAAVQSHNLRLIQRASLDPQASGGASYGKFDRGCSLNWATGTNIQCWYVDNSKSSVGDNSIVLRFSYGQSSYLFTGDVETAGENYIVGNYSQRCGLLKVSSHGSSSKSNSVNFLSLAQPALAIISVGASNSYGYPTITTLTRLRNIYSKIYRTDLNSEIVVLSDALGNYRVISGSGTYSPANSNPDSFPAPAPVTNLTASLSGTNKVSLRWSPVTDAFAYEVWRATVSEGVSGIYQYLGRTTDNFYLDENVSGDIYRYFWRLTALSTYYYESDFSPAAQCVRPTLKITSLTVKDYPSDRGGKIVVSWSSEVSADFSHYNVYVTTFAPTSSSGLTPRVSVNNTGPVVIDNLTNLTGYYVSVEAISLGGEKSPLEVATSPVYPVNNIVGPGNYTIYCGKDPKVKIEFSSGADDGLIVDIGEIPSEKLEKFNLANEKARSDIKFVPETIDALSQYSYYISASAEPTRPVLLSLPYDAGKVNVRDIEKLRIVYLDEETGEWKLADFNQSIDTVNQQVLARISHFSIWRVVGMSPAMPDLSQLKVFPNPVKPAAGDNFSQDYITFKYLTRQAKISIFTIDGKLLFSGQKDDDGSVYRWYLNTNDGGAVASGVYLYVVENNNGERRRGKIGIIR